MSTFSIHDRIAGWVDDQIAKEDPLNGDEWGRQVSMVIAPTPNGDAIIWVILLTLRAPFLGLDAIGTTFKIPANVPAETAVRANTAKAVENLRREFTRRRGDGLPPANGHRQALPPGLARKRG
jgi:hypothetical protein